jgi:heterodisulfide reductase subunit B
MEALGVEYKELDEWQCCGAVYPLAKDDISARLSSVRALAEAQRSGSDLLTLCSACHHVLKRVNHDIRENKDIRMKANNYLALDTPYTGETRVVHYMEMLRDTVGFDKLRERSVNPLKGRKLGAYYGCMLLRPYDVMDFDNPENPSIIEDFIKAIGADPITFSYRNECCGGYAALEEKEMVEGLCAAIMDSGKDRGVEALVTSCPLCRYNLTKNSPKDGDELPVYYFTELLAEALGVK